MCMSCIGFVTGTIQARIFHTVPVLANTAPLTGMGTYRTHISMVSHETHGITLTHGILIIKIIEITLLLLLLLLLHCSI